NFDREDERIFEFLRNVGTEEDRTKIKNFQELSFKNKEALLEILKTKATEEGMSWEFGVEKALEYSILEYPFAHWQWGTQTDDISKQIASLESLYDHRNHIVGDGFFGGSSLESFLPYL